MVADGVQFTLSSCIILVLHIRIATESVTAQFNCVSCSETSVVSTWSLKFTMTMTIATAITHSSYIPQDATSPSQPVMAFYFFKIHLSGASELHGLLESRHTHCLASSFDPGSRHERPFFFDLIALSGPARYRRNDLHIRVLDFSCLYAGGCALSALHHAIQRHQSEVLRHQNTWDISHVLRGYRSILGPIHSVEVFINGFNRISST